MAPHSLYQNSRRAETVALLTSLDPSPDPDGRRRRLGVAPTGGRVTQRRRPAKINRSAAAAAAAVLAPRTSRRNLPGRAGSRVVAWQPLLPAVYRRDRPPSSRPPSVFSMHAEQIALRQPLSSRSAGAVAVYISLRHRHSGGGGGGAALQL